MRRSILRTSGFTLLEIVIVVILMAVISFAMYDAYSTGFKAHAAASESLSAVQGALTLMETIQEDLTQLSILNFRNSALVPPLYPSLVPYSMFFSPNGKSFMFRKSTAADTNGQMAGSSFSVVTYYLFRENGLPPSTYRIRRVEMYTDGTQIKGNDEDDRDIRSLLVKDVKYDLVVRLDNMGTYAYQTFVRVSITAVNAGAAQNDNRVFFISNLFNVISPEFINNRPNEVGFARRFDASYVHTFTPPQELLAGLGFVQELPPTNMSFAASFNDYLDSDNSWKAMPVPTTAGGSNPWSGTPPSSKNGNFCGTARDFLKNLVGDTYKGRITGTVVSQPSVTPPWAEAFSFDTTPSSTQTVVVQIQAALDRVKPHGPDAVEDMGHMLSAQPSPPATVITTSDALTIISGG